MDTCRHCGGLRARPLFACPSVFHLQRDPPPELDVDDEATASGSEPTSLYELLAEPATPEQIARFEEVD